MPQIKAVIGADTRQFDAAMRRVTNNIKALDGLKKIGATIAGMFAVNSVAGFASELNKTAVSLQAISAKAAIVFGDYRSEVKAVADSSAISLGLTSNEFLKAASSAADLLIPMGFARKDAAKMSTELINLSGALSAWTGGQFDSIQVSEILTKALLGEREGLKNLGISISEADITARLAADGNDKLTGSALEQAKATAALDLIMSKSVDAQTAFASGTKTLAMQQAELSARFTEVKETIAEKLTPVILKVSTFFADMFETIDSATDSFEQQKNKVAGLTGEIGPLLTRYDDLRSKTLLSKTEQEEMATIIGKVATAMPSAITAFDQYGNAIGISTSRARQFIDTEIARLKVMNKDAIDEVKDNIKSIDSELSVLDKKLKEVAQKGTFTVAETSYMGPGQGRINNRKATEEEIRKAQSRFQELAEMRLGYNAELQNLNGEVLKQEVEIATTATDGYNAVTTAISTTTDATKDLIKANKRLAESIPTMEPRTGNLSDNLPAGVDRDVYNQLSGKAKANQDAQLQARMQPRAVGEAKIAAGSWADSWGADIEVLKEVNEQVEASFESMASSVGQSIGNLISGTGSVGDIFSGILVVIADFMKTLGESLIAAAFAATAFKSLLANPFAALAAGVALVALSAVVKNALTAGPGGDSGGQPRKFADGGVVFGPTFGLLGEYANASRNPEVVSPLSTLKSLLGGNSQDVMVYGSLQGEDLIISNNRTMWRRNRIKG